MVYLYALQPLKQRASQNRILYLTDEDRDTYRPRLKYLDGNGNVDIESVMNTTVIRDSYEVL